MIRALLELQSAKVISMRLSWASTGDLILEAATPLDSPEAAAVWCRDHAGRPRVDWRHLGRAFALLVASRQAPTPSLFDNLLKLLDSYYVSTPPAASSAFDAGVNEAAVLVRREGNAIRIAVDVWIEQVT